MVESNKQKVISLIGVYNADLLNDPSANFLVM